MDKELYIIAIKILDRIKESERLQKVLSDYSASIKTRFGHHDLNDYKCSREGFIILELDDSVDNCLKLIAELEKIGGIIVKTMNFKI